MRATGRWAWVAIAFASLAGARCARDETSLLEAVSSVLPNPAEGAAEASSLAELRRYEEHRRRSADLTRYAPLVERLGSEPYSVVAVPAVRSARFAVLLRHEDTVVLLDDGLREISRAPSPRLGSDVAVDAKGRVYASGAGSDVVLAYDIVEDALVAKETVSFSPETSIRALSVRPSDGALVAIDELADEVLVAHAGKVQRISVPRGPNRVVSQGDKIFVSSLVDHSVSAVSKAGDATLLFRHEAPILGFDVARRGDGWVVIAGHVEDHALDRRGGSFGYIDSFISRYTCDAALLCELSHRVNVGALEVVTPKVVAFDGHGRVFVVGYGSSRALLLDGATLDVVSTSDLVPGISDVAMVPTGLAFADPLLDAVGLFDGQATRVVRLASHQRQASSRVGELLFYTTLMAPWQRSDAELSRFTCETCHFEGLTDGRTHATGRGDVRATTKPLRGLFTNGPHFSRALDEDLSEMTHAEFRVAAARSDHGHWFGLDEITPAARAVLDSAALEPADMAALSSPESLRRAFVDFLVDFAPAPNPYAVRRSALNPLERRGSEVFRDSCTSCHAARLVANDPASEVPFEAWERLVMSPEGPIVWARDGYEKTGVEPYVSEDGARPTSLRRTVQKRVYMTNGKASSLEDVVKEVAFGRDGKLLHASREPGLRRLEADAQRALIAFLRLL